MSQVLRLNPIACDAHGVCADLLPEMVRLDPWGYPVIAAGPVPPELMEHARRAVASCPTLALRLERQQPRRRTPETRGNLGVAADYGGAPPRDPAAQDSDYRRGPW